MSLFWHTRVTTPDSDDPGPYSLTAPPGLSSWRLGDILFSIIARYQIEFVGSFSLAWWKDCGPQVHTISVLDLADAGDLPLFHNSSISRRLPAEAILTVLEDLVQQWVWNLFINFAQNIISLCSGNLEWTDKSKRRGHIFWKSPAQLGQEIYKWAPNQPRIFNIFKPGGCRTPVRRAQWSHWSSLRRREKQTHGAELVKRWCSWWSWKLGCQNIWLTQLPPGDREGAENLGSRAEVWDFWWDGRGQVLLEGAGRGQVRLVRAGPGPVLLDVTEHYHCHIIHAPGFFILIHELISCSSITPPTCHNIHEMPKRNRTWRKSKCDSPPINLIFVKSFHVVVENSCDPSKPAAYSVNYLGPVQNFRNHWMWWFQKNINIPDQYQYK